MEKFWKEIWQILQQNKKFLSFILYKKYFFIIWLYQPLDILKRFSNWLAWHTTVLYQSGSARI